MQTELGECRSRDHGIPIGASRTAYRPTTGWLVFLLRVLVFSALIAPIALGQDAAPNLLLAPPALPLPDEQAETEPPSPNLPNGGLPQQVPPLPQSNDQANYAPTPEIGTGGYWIVSSRCSVQQPWTPGRWGVDVYQRVGECPLIPADLSALSSQLVPGIPVLIYAHGSFVSWESQCREAHEAYHVFRSICRPVQVIFFTWPSQGPHRLLYPIDAAMLGERAEFNGFHLAWLIAHIPETCPICLVGHSHGTRTILSTLHLAGGGTVQGHYFPASLGARRYRAVLAAAAIDHHWLNPGQRYGCALHSVECLLNLRNRRDFALAFYPINRPLAHRALARSGFTRRDQAQIGWNLAKIREVDVTLLLGPRHLWPYYYSDPTVASLIRSYAQFGM